jgi:hypothetical protein
MPISNILPRNKLHLYHNTEKTKQKELKSFPNNRKENYVFL